MNQTFFYDVNGDYVTNNIVENFGISAGNSTNVNNSKNYKTLSEIEKNIDRSTMIKGLTKLVSDSVTKVIAQNTSELAKSIALSNKINISKIKATNVSLTDITQSVKVDSETSANFVQKIQGKVKNEISKTISDKISKLVDTSKTINQENVEDTNEATSIGNVLNNVVDKAADTIKDVLSISAGNTTNTDNSVNISKSTKEKLKLDESFKMEKNQETSNKISNVLDNKNLSKCANDTKQSNELNFSDAELSGNLEVKNLKQVAAVNSVMSCAFNNEIINDVATKILEDFEKNIENMIKSADDFAKKNNTTSTSGDIYAIGVAGSKVLESAGKGVASAAEGAGKGIKDAGKGVADAAEGVGKGIGSALTGLMGPLLIGGLLLIVVAIGYFIFKNMMNDEDDE